MRSKLRRCSAAAVSSGGTAYMSISVHLVAARGAGRLARSPFAPDAGRVAAENGGVPVLEQRNVDACFAGYRLRLIPPRDAPSGKVVFCRNDGAEASVHITLVNLRENGHAGRCLLRSDGRGGYYELVDALVRLREPERIARKAGG